MAELQKMKDEIDSKNNPYVKDVLARKPAEVAVR